MEYVDGILGNVWPNDLFIRCRLSPFCAIFSCLATFDSIRGSLNDVCVRIALDCANDRCIIRKWKEKWKWEQPILKKAVKILFYCKLRLPSRRWSSISIPVSVASSVSISRWWIFFACPRRRLSIHFFGFASITASLSTPFSVFTFLVSCTPCISFVVLFGWPIVVAKYLRNKWKIMILFYGTMCFESTDLIICPGGGIMGICGGIPIGGMCCCGGGTICGTFIMFGGIIASANDQ